MPILNQPSFTESYDSTLDFTPDQDSIYVTGLSVEERSAHFRVWGSRITNVVTAMVANDSRDAADIATDTEHFRVSLRGSRDLKSFWSKVHRPVIYLDITGLRHHVWASLLRSALDTRSRVIVIYVEPAGYRPSLTPTESDIFDLSERVEGIAPLPGFARLKESGDSSCFVPLLGFEGTRVSYLISQLEPPGGKTIPVVGIPGFRAEYPFATYLGNRHPLIQTQAWKKVRYARANCPFDLYFLLEQLERDYSGHILKIAPIGTKPHAVGAVLFALAKPRIVELVYDHPIRKAQRTEGTARLLAYHVSSLFR